MCKLLHALGVVLNVRTFLSLLAERPLASVRPEGEQVKELINKYCTNVYGIADLTGITACEAIDALAPKDRDEVYLTELNDGMDLVQYRRELQSLLDEKNDGKGLRKFLAFGMATLMAIGSLSLSFAICWIAYHEKTLPPWELCLIALGGPVMVVWQYNGVLTQERKDFLAAALGRTPQAGIIGGLLSNMGVSKDVRRRRDDVNEEDFQSKQRLNNRPTTASADHGGPPAV